MSGVYRYSVCPSSTDQTYKPVPGSEVINNEHKCIAVEAASEYNLCERIKQIERLLFGL